MATLAGWLAAVPARAQEVVVHSTDAELAEAVTAELRAIGNDGMRADGPVLVALTRDGDSILVQVQEPGRARQERVSAPRDSGLGVAPTRALAIVEVVRSLVADDSEPDDGAPAMAVEPPTPGPIVTPPMPPAASSPPAVPYRYPAPFPTLGYPGYQEDGVLRPVEETTLRLGFASGVDYVAPVWSVVAGLTLRGQVHPLVTLLGTLRYGHDLEDGYDADFRVHRIQAAFGGAWEMLGVDGPVSPSLGLAARSDLIFFRNVGARRVEGAGMTLSPVVVAGLAFGGPFRGRLDVEAGVRALGDRVDGATRGKLTDAGVPIVNVTLGMEYDVVTSTTMRRQARRH